MKIANEDLQKFINSLETQQPISGNLNQLDQNIYQDNNEKPPKKKVNKAYSTTKVKAPNLLTNLSYTRWSEEDFKKKSFTIDIITYFLQYLNLSGLDRKLETEDERNQKNSFGKIVFQLTFYILLWKRRIIKVLAYKIFPIKNVLKLYLNI